jgi:hypothetical protein
VPVESITKRVSVNGVVKNSPSINMRRRSIVPVHVVAVFDTNERGRVYNLTVEGGEYFANGVLVHNCDTLRYAVMYLDGQEQVQFGPNIWG